LSNKIIVDLKSVNVLSSSSKGLHSCLGSGSGSVSGSVSGSGSVPKKNILSVSFASVASIIGG